jgi:AraC-like DNA-binding protein
LLAERKLSVTEIGFDVGSSETSSFTAAFRKYSMIAPLFDATNPYAAIHQLLEADIVYVRDFTRPNAMSNEQLGQRAMIALTSY